MLLPNSNTGAPGGNHNLMPTNAQGQQESSKGAPGEHQQSSKGAGREHEGSNKGATRLTQKIINQSFINPGEQAGSTGGATTIHETRASTGLYRKKATTLSIPGNHQFPGFQHLSAKRNKAHEVVPR